MRTRSRLTSLLTTSSMLAAAWLAVPAPAMAAVSSGAPVVIDEVYGGGGNTGATYRQDFVELFNRSAAPVDLSGWSVQYASATGTSWAVTPLTGTLPAGSSYVVRQAPGSGGTTDVPSDVTGTTAMGGTAGKVALVSASSALTCGADCDGNAAVVDFVGYGSANDFAGTGPAPAPSSTTSVSRTSHVNTADNAADFTAGAPSPAACGTACAVVAPPPASGERTIGEIQGPGASSPLVNSSVRTRGVVTAAYPAGGLRGFYLQTPGTGGPVDPTTDTTSDGIFVFQASGVLPAFVQVGSYLQVTGQVSEFFGQTQLTVASTDVVDLGTPPAAVTAATTAGWPTTNAARESLEGMLYRPTGAFTVTNTFSTNQFGEVGLASGTTPLVQRTQVERPGPAAASAVEADNAARAVTLDDGASTNFLAVSSGALANGHLTPPYVSNSAPVRVGAPVTFTADVIVDWRNSAWKFQPTRTITGPDNTGAPATFGNTRTPAPDEALLGKADLKVASFNVLNYFTTLGTDSASCTAFKDRSGDGATVNGGCDQRGAWDSQDLARQQVKIVEAINALDADVVGLMEIENSARLGETPDEALQTLVAALNADAGAGTWAANPSSTELPAVSEMDVITSAIIYKPAAVTRVGASRALGTQSAAGGAFDNAREPVAQVFAPVAGGASFLFVVNHFKSKGSAGPWPGDVDTGDGQGSSNESRVRQATALRDWVPTVLAGTGTQAVVMAGDYNSYAKEDPLQVLYDAGYSNVEERFDNGEHSYSFSGLAGSLDHVLVNADAAKRATGADIWNINSGESLALEYSRWNYHATDFHRPDPYRSSDHDPVVLGLAASAPTQVVQVLGINDFHGRIQANGVEAGAGVLAGAVKQLRAQYPETVFAAAGDLIGASTFESFINKDKPTLDALNSAGLEVSAVGNHEFDQGYDDLVNRVMKPYDATTNPYGGASWKYLGANVRHAADHSAALPETWIKDFGGVQVGFVGAVTDHLPELVSPAGIAGLEIESPVVAANRHADELKAAGADIVVLLVHEGAATTALSSATDPATDFGKIVTGVNANVDAIVSGHTHLAYNHAVTVPAWVDQNRPVTTRPVVSAGQYGYNLDQLLFSVDPDTDRVVGLQQNLLSLTPTPPYPTDAPTKAIVDKAVADAAVLGAQPLGQITGAFNRARTVAGAENRGGESTLGNLVAEVQQTATESPTAGAAQIAFMNPGGLRADLVGSGSTSPTTVTYRQAANVQPFANTLVNLELTGAQVKTALEQQWQPAGAARPFLRLGISEGFTYTYDARAAAGSRITRMWLHGVPIDPSAVYSVTVNSFLASGGDNFGVFAQGADRRDTGQSDLQAMVDHLARRSPVSPDRTQRSVGVMFPAGAPAAYYAGDPVTFDLSSLAFSTAADLKDSSVTVSLGTTRLGTFPVDNTLSTAVTDEHGTATVAFTLPAGIPAGEQSLTVTGAQTGTTTTVPVRVAQDTSTTTSLSASASSQTHGTTSPATLTATVALSDGRAPAGSVRFSTSTGTVLATVPVTSGTAQLQVPATTAAGSWSFTATFVPTPGSRAAGSTSPAVAFTVVQAFSTTGLTSTVTRVRGTSSLQLTADVRLDTGAAPAGTVRFFVDRKVVGQAPVGAGGRSSVTVPVERDKVQVRAEFTPTDTANVLGSTSTTSTVTVR